MAVFLAVVEFFGFSSTSFPPLLLPGEERQCAVVSETLSPFVSAVPPTATLLSCSPMPTTPGCERGTDQA